MMRFWRGVNPLLGTQKGHAAANRYIRCLLSESGASGLSGSRDLNFRRIPHLTYSFPDDDRRPLLWDLLKNAAAV